MSEEDKTAMRRFYEEVFNQGKLAVADEISTPDLVDQDIGNPSHDQIGEELRLPPLVALEAGR